MRFFVIGGKCIGWYFELYRVENGFELFIFFLILIVGLGNIKGGNLNIFL